ncbi:putative isoprenylcysteine carboxyl methyltransferase [Xylariaceae sp. FL0594]|nr:putative isoprenylcysteine carboxyl methyltransferase [Xylariaceae sp. FL0594]
MMDDWSQSPAAASAQIQMVRLSDLGPGHRLSLEGIAVRSFSLGVALALSALATVSILLLTSSPLWRVPFFAAALSTFHFLEFWTTARYNTPVAHVDSFLLTANWPAYQIAHAAAVLECLVVHALFPARAWAPFYSGHVLLLVGCACVVLGQAGRSAAMVQAGRSFNHVIQVKKRDDHELVTTGLYACARHPSYAAFFFWGLGTQLVLGNPFCFIAYALVLWRFFSARIRHEEQVLLSHYGEAYRNYKEHVRSGIPLVR